MYQETADWLHPVETFSPVNWCSYQNNRNFAKIDNPPIDVFSAPPFALPKDNYQVFEGSTTQGFAGLFILRLRCQCPFMVPTLVLLRWDCVVRIARPHPRIIFVPCCVFSSTWHFFNLLFCQLIISSTYFFINLFYQLVDAWTCCFINLMFCHIVILSAYHFFSLLFHQFAVLPTCHSINWLFHRLVVSTTCYFVNLPFC